jgi:hypothetical protein
MPYCGPPPSPLSKCCLVNGGEGGAVKDSNRKCILPKENMLKETYFSDSEQWHSNIVAFLIKKRQNFA